MHYTTSAELQAMRLMRQMGFDDPARPASGGEAEVRRDAYGRAKTPSACDAVAARSAEKGTPSDSGVAP